jgi:tetratricopeptide (TPR) repeat protein
VFDLPFISFAVVSPLSLIGLCLTIKRKGDVLLPTLFVLGGALSVILFFVSARYRLPVVPLLIVYAAWSIHRLALWLKGRDYKKAVAFMVSTACLAAVLGIGGTTTGETNLERASHYTNLGLVHLRQGRHDPGMTELRKALAISPSFAYARYNLGVALLEQGRFDNAVSQFSHAVRYRPGYAKAYYNMGLAHAAKGQTDQATAAFRKATVLNPSYVEAHNNLGVAALSGRNYTEAANHFRKAIEVDPDFAEGHKNLAYTYWLLGERASAKRELGKLKSLNREMWKGLQRLLSQTAEE